MALTCRIFGRRSSCVLSELLNFVGCILFLSCVVIDARGLQHHHANNRRALSSRSMLFVPQPFDDNRAMAASLLRRTRADGAGPYMEPLPTSSERERAVEMLRHGLRMRNSKQTAAAVAAATAAATTASAALAAAPADGNRQVAAPTFPSATFKSTDGDSNNAQLLLAQAASGSRPTLDGTRSLREFLVGLKSRLQAANGADADALRQSVLAVDERNWNNLAAFDGLSAEDADEIEAQASQQPRQILPAVTESADAASSLPLGKSQVILGRLRGLVSSRERPVTDDMARFRYAIAG